MPENRCIRILFFIAQQLYFLLSFKLQTISIVIRIDYLQVKIHNRDFLPEKHLNPSFATSCILLVDRQSPQLHCSDREY